MNANPVSVRNATMEARISRIMRDPDVYNVVFYHVKDGTRDPQPVFEVRADSMDSAAQLAKSGCKLAARD